MRKCHRTQYVIVMIVWSGLEDANVSVYVYNISKIFKKYFISSVENIILNIISRLYNYVLNVFNIP